MIGKAHADGAVLFRPFVIARLVEGFDLALANAVLCNLLEKRWKPIGDMLIAHVRMLLLHQRNTRRSILGGVGSFNQG